MKQRVISGIIITLLIVVTVLLGGVLFKATAFFIAVCGTYEFAKCRKREINWVEFAFMLLAVILINLGFYDKTLAILLSLIIVLLTLAVFNPNYSFEDACVSCLEAAILAITVHELIHIREISKYLLGYIIIVSYITDVFALFTGMKFGKHKLNERVSPKKTIEGAIGGWFFGGLLSFVWASFFNYFDLGFEIMLICSIILPVVSQIGDLAFSLIKRTYGIKDFSNLIPGHGGVLDRIDSLSFVLITMGVIFVFI